MAGPGAGLVMVTVTELVNGPPAGEMTGGGKKVKTPLMFQKEHFGYAEDADVQVLALTYGKKDLAGVVALWSENSPSLATYKQSLERQLTLEDLSFGPSEISSVKVEGGKASLRVTIALTSINRKNQQKSEQRLVRIFEFIREGQQWKIWRYAPAAEDLARALAKADNEAERAGLLAEEKELVGVELGRALLAQGRQLPSVPISLETLSSNSLMSRAKEAFNVSRLVIIIEARESIASKG